YRAPKTPDPRTPRFSASRGRPTSRLHASGARGDPAERPRRGNQRRQPAYGDGGSTRTVGCMTVALLHADAQRLLERWTPPDADAAATRVRMLALLDLGPRVMLRDGHVDHFTASTLVLDSAGERVLLCLHRRLGRWVQLGGHCEPGDANLAAAALREATEESGIGGLRMLTEPIGLDVHEVHCSAGPSRHFDVRF